MYLQEYLLCKEFLLLGVASMKEIHVGKEAFRFEAVEVDLASA
jgi:hypothetical protein